MGLFGSARSAATAVAALTAGLLAERVGGITAIAVVGIVGAVLAAGHLGLRSTTTPLLPTFTARGSMRILLDRPLLRRVTTAHALYGAGISAAVPLFALVHVDRLGLTLADVGVIGVVGAIATTATYPMWGLLVDRVSPMAVLRLGTLCGMLAVVAYTVAPSMAVLLVAATLLGAAGAATDTGILAVLAEETSLEERGAALAGWNGTTGVWGIASPLAMSLLVQAGAIRLDAALLACALLSATGVALYLRAAGFGWRRLRLAASGPRVVRPGLAELPAEVS
jgi:MFS family permease